MIYRNTPEGVDAYYANPAMNQSSLKTILNEGMQAFLAKGDELLKKDDLYYSEKEHQIIGSGVDCKLTMGEDVFQKKYHVSSLVKKPSPAVMSIIKDAFDTAKAANGVVNPGLKYYNKTIYDACNRADYFTNRKKADYTEDTRIESILKQNGEDYWGDLIEAGDKQVLSDIEVMTIEIVTNSYKTHKHTARFFPDEDKVPDNIDIIYQFAIEFEYLGVGCKALVDEIYIDHSAKTIFLLDAKTTREFILKFKQEARAWRYDIQLAFYHHGLSQKHTIEVLETIISKSLEHYRIASPALLVESTRTPGTPLVFPLSDKLLNIGKTGDGLRLRGWLQGLQIYNTWKEGDFSIEQLTAPGYLVLNENFEYDNLKAVIV